MKGLKCPTCGLISVQGAFQCPNCETKLKAVQVEDFSQQQVEESYRVFKSGSNEQEEVNRNLVECSDCGEHISKSANACPHCGAKKSKPLGGTIAVMLIFSFFMMYFVSSLFSDSKSHSAASEKSRSFASYEPSESELNRIISNSDDLSLYADAFKKASRALVKNGRCDIRGTKDIYEFGWTKSTTTHADQPVYFTYCFLDEIKPYYTVKDRVYLNVESGRIF